MPDKDEARLPICPSCGEPVRRFKVSDKVKIVVSLLAIGYFIVSLLVLVVVSPANGAGRGCRRYDYIHKPDWCKDTEFKLSVRPLNDDPALRTFVAGGLAAGILFLYWDWLESHYEKWCEKRENSSQGRERKYRHTCRCCGRQWN